MRYESRWWVQRKDVSTEEWKFLIINFGLFWVFLFFLADKCIGSSNETFKIVHAVLTVNL